MNGVPLPVVARLLGHSNVCMTMGYAHVGDSENDAAAERVGKGDRLHDGSGSKVTAAPWRPRSLAVTDQRPRGLGVRDPRLGVHRLGCHRSRRRLQRVDLRSVRRSVWLS